MEVKGRVMEERSGLERVMGFVPGYHGYKEKEVRREADKLLRMHLARQFEEGRGELAILQQKLADRGMSTPGVGRVLVGLERAMLKLQLLIDRLKTAAYGYSGWFDAVKVNESELDALYAFDHALVEEAEKVSSRIKKAEGITDEGVLEALAEDLLTTLEAINTSFTRRQDVILLEKKAEK